MEREQTEQGREQEVEADGEGAAGVARGRCAGPPWAGWSPPCSSPRILLARPAATSLQLTRRYSTCKTWAERSAAARDGRQGIPAEQNRSSWTWRGWTAVIAGAALASEHSGTRERSGVQWPFNKGVRPLKYIPRYGIGVPTKTSLYTFSKHETTYKASCVRHQRLSVHGGAARGWQKCRQLRELQASH